MDVVALVSGGKDSCMAMLECVRAGHRIVALANLLPPASAPDELDSFMFQTVGHTVLQSYAQCMGLPLFRHTIRGKALNQDLHYAKTREDEVESLYVLLKEVKKRYPGVQGVASGAILSDYQRFRVENVCERLGLVSLAYLWQRDQKELLQEMTQVPIDAVLIKVAAMGLDPYKHLGKSITALRPLLFRLSDEYGCHPCGEGGEYETLTLDCPLFRYKIVMDETEVVIHSDDQFAQVGYLHVSKHHLEPKAGCDPAPGEGVVYDVWKELTTTDECDSGEGEPMTVGELHQMIGRSDEISLTYRADGYFFVRGGSVAAGEPADEGGDTIESQLDRIFSAIKLRLAEEGSLEMEDVCFVCLYLRDMSLFVRCNGVYRRHFGANPPSRLCVQMPLTDNAHILLECFGQQRHPRAEVERNRRRVLHVQSISRWAPACIGPYSQATTLNGLVHLAGQIGLDPATMKLVGSDEAMPVQERIREQALLCFHNIDQVLSVMQTSAANVVVGTCFVVDMAHRDLILDLWRQWLLAGQRASPGKAKATTRSRPRSGLGSDSESESEDDEEQEREDDDDYEEEEEGGHHEGTEAEPLVRFIKVGALPKGALVEFQVIATVPPTATPHDRSSGRRQRLPRGTIADDSSQSASSPSAEVVVEGVWSPTHGYCFAQTRIAGGTTASHAVEAVKRAVQAADPRLWDRRLFFRIYFPATRPIDPETLDRLRESVAPALVSTVPCAGLGEEGGEDEGTAALLECVVLPPTPPPPKSADVDD